jgi:serine/threonine protein kinase
MTSESSKIFERRSLEVDTDHDNIIVRPDGTKILCDSPNSCELPAYPDEMNKKPQVKTKPSLSVERVKPKRIIGNYTLVNTLGSGSMGKVRLAVHNITGDKVCRGLVVKSTNL